VTQFSQGRNLNNVFERRTKFVIAVNKAQWDEGGGRILLGDDAGGGAVMMQPIGSSVLVVLTSTGRRSRVQYRHTRFPLAPGLLQR
jgi:hypothetical protein